MNRDQRIVNEWVRSVTTDGLGAPPRVVEAIDRLTAKRPARKHLAPGKTKAQRDAEHRDETAKLRVEVMRLANLACERCRAMTLPALGHMHHTIGGGLRRSRQSIENVAWLCPACHRVMHREPKLAREFRERLKLVRTFGQPAQRTERTGS